LGNLGIKSLLQRLRQFPIILRSMSDMEIKTISVRLDNPTVLATDWNRRMHPKIEVDLRPDLLKSLPNARILISGAVSSKVRVHSRSWFFIPPNDEAQNEKIKEPKLCPISEPEPSLDAELDPYFEVYFDTEHSQADEQTDVAEPHTDTAEPLTDVAEPHDDSPLHKEEIESLTRIRIPRDAVKIQDRLNYILQPPIESILNLPTLEMPFDPFPFQREGIAFLYSSHFAILADEMGLGKTMQAITTIRLLIRTGEVRSVLLICPKPLLTNWQREFEQWAPEINVKQIDGSPLRRKWLWQVPGIPVRLANYELLNRDREFFDPPEGEEAPKFDLVVLDESQRVKNKNNATSEAARSIHRVRNWALTGTPVENSAEDLVGIFEFLSTGFLQSGLKPTEISKIVGEHILRRTKDSVQLQIPPKMMRDALLSLTPEQSETYRIAEEEGVLRLSEAGEEITIPQVFELILRLKQICNFDPATGESAKLQQLLADMEEIAQSGRKAIVFSQWVDTLYRLKGPLERFGTTEYHGKIPSNKRDEMIRTFREDKDVHVILMSYGAGAVGLNLQFAGYVFLFDRWWNPAVEDQAINRAHRIGASGPVTVTRFISTNTVEERINRTLEEKRNLSEQILSGARGINSSNGLNQEELFGLFNLQVPAKLIAKSKKAA